MPEPTAGRSSSAHPKVHLMRLLQQAGIGRTMEGECYFPQGRGRSYDTLLEDLEACCFMDVWLSRPEEAELRALLQGYGILWSRYAPELLRDLLAFARGTYVPQTCPSCHQPCPPPPTDG